MGRSTRRRFLAATGLSLAVAGCLTTSDERELAAPESAPDDDWSEPDWGPAAGTPAEDDVEPTTAVSGLEVPWDLAFAGGDAFVSERDGGVFRFDAERLADGSDRSPADGEAVLEGEELPDRAAPGEGGTLGVAAHPDYPDRRELYVYYTADDGGVENRVVRYDLASGELERVLEGIPGASIHNGGRIAFGPDGDLWVLTGDADDPSLAQDPGSLAGAVLRIAADGEPADGNPDWGADGDDRTYTLGHRNPQGISFTPQGTPVIAEHGPESRDEVSVLRPGGNYGWDLVRGGPNDPDYGSYEGSDGATPPVVNTGPGTTWAPSGTTFYGAGAIGAWENRLLVSGLGSTALHVVSLYAGDAPPGDATATFDADWLDDRFTATAEPLFERAVGRIRHVEAGPDGSLYLLTSNRDGRIDGEFPRADDDRIVRLDPA